MNQRDRVRFMKLRAATSHGLALLALLAVAACSSSNDGGKSVAPPVSTPPSPPPLTDRIVDSSGAQLVVPHGALTEPVTLRLARDATGAPPLPTGWKVAGAVYQATPHGTRFAVPVTVHLPAPAIELAPTEELLVAKAQPGGEWQLLPTRRQGSDLVVEVDSLSYFQTVIVGYLLPLQQLAPLTATVSVTCDGQPCVQPVSGTPLLQFTITTNGGQIPSDCAAPRLRFMRTVPVLDFAIDSGGWSISSGTPRTATISDRKPSGGLYGDRTDWSWAVGLTCDTTAGYPKQVLTSTRLTYAAPVVTPLTFSIQAASCNGVPCASPLTGPQNIAITWKGNGGTRPSCTSGETPRVRVFAQYNGGSQAYLAEFGLGSDSATGGSFVSTDTVTLSRLGDGTGRYARYLSELYCPGTVGRVLSSVNLYWADDAASSPYAPFISGQPGSVVVTAGQTASFSAVVFTGYLIQAGLQWQQRMPDAAWADIPGATTNSHTTPMLDLGDTGRQYRIVASSSYGTVTSQIATVSVTSTPVAPFITTQPMPLAVVTGSEAVFAVVASGTAALGYQWYHNGREITGENAPVLKLGPVSTRDAGLYSVKVSNNEGEVTSTAAELNVNSAAPATAAPTIVTQPAALTVTQGNTATFAIGVSGTGPFTYQWLLDGREIPEATAAAYTLQSATLNDVGSYSVRVGNAAGSVTSMPAKLTVTTSTSPVVTPPNITTHPATLVVAPGASATLAVAVSGTSPFTYQWFRNGAPVGGASGAVLTLTSITAIEGGSYTVSVSNSAGTVTSNAAEVIVLGVPAITSQPSAQTATDGGTAIFSVVASGSSLRYQWLRDGQGIPGAESASYTTASLSMSNSGALYSVIVYNAAGLVISQAAALTVTAAAPTITVPPADVAANEGSTATFTVLAAGTAPLSYQWRRNGVAVTGATTSTYTTPSLTTGDNGALFSVVVENSAGSVMSPAATLTVNTASSPMDRLQFFGAIANFAHQLWVTDGTPAGTRAITTWRPAENYTVTQADLIFARLGAAVYFPAIPSDQVAGSTLWRSDGTAAGTTPVTNGLEYVGIPIVPCGGRLFFAGRQRGASSMGLWTSDGTSAGTRRVGSVVVSGVGTRTDFLVCHDGIAYFTGNTVENGSEPWRSDGTETGTYLLRDLQPGTAPSQPSGFASRLGKLLFIASISPNSADMRLHVSDGTEGGTFTASGALARPDANFAAASGLVYFGGTGSSSAVDLFHADANGLVTQVGTALAPKSLTPFGDRVFFFGAIPAESDIEPHVAAGGGATLLSRINPNGPSYSVTGVPASRAFGSLGGKVLFPARTDETADELWISDGTGNGTQLLKDLVTGTVGSSPRGFVRLGNVVLFTANANATGARDSSRFWVTDGTVAGTQPLSATAEVVYY